MKKFVILSTFVLATQWPDTLWAQQHAHQRNLLPGGRASALGGAFTALSDDPSGGYYNPAGIINAPRNEVSASSNAYRESLTTYADAVAGEDFVETSNAIYPSFLGGLYKTGSLAGAWSYMTLDARNINQNHRFESISSVDGEASSYSRTHQEVNSYIHAGASAAWAVTKNLSVGTSLFYYRREIQSTNHQLTQYNGGGLLVLDFKYNTLNEGFVPVAGVLWKGQTWSFGLSGRIPTAYSNRTRYTSDSVVYVPAEDATTSATPSATTRQGKSTALDEPNPNSAQAGLAWTPTKWFLLTTDVIAYGPVDMGVHGQDLHQTNNYSLGMEIDLPALFAGSGIALRSGVFTNNSLYRRPSTGKTEQPTWIDLRGTTGGLALRQKDREGTISYVRQQGTGEAQIITDSSTIQTVSSESAIYMVTGSVYF